jgi:nicotinamidase-related amidase
VTTVLVPDAAPAPWPVLGRTALDATALVVIDLQRDFCDDAGWFGSLGFDLSDCQRATAVVRGLLVAARVAGMPVVLTRQGNAADLADLPAPRREQGRRHGSPIGTPGPLGRALVRGEPGWDLVDKLREPGDLVVDKPGFSCFAGTDLHERLQDRGVRALALCGVTANVCVLATLYAAVDLGYDCVTVADGVGAATPALREGVLDLVRYQGGLFGCVATADQLAAAFAAGG